MVGIGSRLDDSRIRHHLTVSWPNIGEGASVGGVDASGRVDYARDRVFGFLEETSQNSLAILRLTRELMLVIGYDWLGIGIGSEGRE